MAVSLRPYQQKAVENIFNEWGSGHRRTLLVQATGTGKTVVFAEVVRRVAERGGRSLVLAHRGELLEQAADKISKVTGMTCAVEKADRSSLDSWNRVTVGSVQSLCNERRLDKFPKDRFQCIVVDEAHHAVSDTYERVLGHFDADVLGVTATADRADRKDLGEVFDSIAYEYDMAHAIHDHYLSPIVAEMVPLSIDISKVKVTGGDYSADDLGDTLEPYLDAIADEMAARCSDRKSVVFLPLVRTAKAFADMLVAHGMDAREVDGNSADRAEVEGWFDQAGPNSVLCNSMLLTEGWDCPSVDCVVVLRPTKSRALYTQMVGRGTRLSPDTGKRDMLLLDFLWLTERHSLCRPASLFAKTDRGEELATKAIEDAGAPIDLEDATNMGEGDAQAERERALAEQLDEQRHKKAKLVDPLLYEMSIMDQDMQSYEPTFAWERDEPTDGQVKALEKWGINPDGLCKGKASMMLDRLQQRKESNMATPKQVRMLERKGFRHPGEWTKDQAAAMMTRLANNHWRVPWDVDPATYVPPSDDEKKVG